MKLTCDVVTQNRELPSFNMKGPSRPVRATFTLGKKTSSAPNVALLVCTAQNRNGNLYKVKGNVLQIFRKFVDDGKATIRFQEPSHDVCLMKADPIQLKSFLRAISLLLCDKGLKSVHWSHLTPATSAQVARLPTRLKIEKRRDYPAIGQLFPKSLQSVTVNNCCLEQIDNRILRLQHVTVLNLSCNKLQQLPAQLAGNLLPSLAWLDLSHNNLHSIPHTFFQSHLKNTLTSLVLNHNFLKSLPCSICDLTALLDLSITDNMLLEIPHQIGKLSTTLRTLLLSQNQLTFLPGSIKSLRLDSVDVYGNKFATDVGEAVIVKNCLSVPTLVESAARIIVDKRVVHEDDLPRELLQYMQRPQWCYCGKSCFDSFALLHKTVDLRNLATTVVSANAAGWTPIPIQSFVCSAKCLATH